MVQDFLHQPIPSFLTNPPSDRKPSLHAEPPITAQRGQAGAICQRGTLMGFKYQGSAYPPRTVACKALYVLQVAWWGPKPSLGKGSLSAFEAEGLVLAQGPLLWESCRGCLYLGYTILTVNARCQKSRGRQFSRCVKIRACTGACIPAR